MCGLAAGCNDNCCCISLLSIAKILVCSVKTGNVAGCFVKTGKILRNALIKVVREGNIIHEGRLASLRVVKDDVKEVRQGLECGIKIAGFDDLKVGDIIEAYEVQQVARTLS